MKDPANAGVGGVAVATATWTEGTYTRLDLEAAAPDQLADLLFELKQVPLKKVGLTGAERRELGETAVRSLAPVQEAFSEARAQLERYRSALPERFGETLRLRSRVVAVGLERLVGEEV